MEDRSWERSWAAIKDGSEWSAQPAGTETTDLDGNLPEDDPRVPEWMSSDENETGMDAHAASTTVPTSDERHNRTWSEADHEAWSHVQSEVNGADVFAASPHRESAETSVTREKRGGMDLRAVSFTPGEAGGSVRVELHCGQQEIAATWTGDQTKSLLDGPLGGLVPGVDQVTLRRGTDDWKLEVGLRLGESTVTGTWSIGAAVGEVALPLETVQAEIRREFVRTLQAALEWSNELAPPLDASLDPVA